jgi:UDP-N-acetylmuramate--alanine ligase
MSALAELLVRRGVVVTGCDVNPAGAATDLRRAGVDVVDHHDPAHVENARAVVVSSAVPKDHPELQRARERGIPVTRRAEALGEATSGSAENSRELVGVAGTHGKSTTTVMAAEALAAAGRQPTALVGARVPRWHGNLRVGGDRLFVVEADEYDRSFLALTPTVAVVTNVEADHLDVFADLREIKRAFSDFIRPARTIVLCADDPGAASLQTPSTTEVIRYGIESPDARLRATGVRAGTDGMTFQVDYDGEKLGEVGLRVFGPHNVLNALAALASGLALGAPFALLSRGLGEFGGAERRFERLGEAAGVTIVDDYAHHPTEIGATLAAARSSYPGRRIVVAFQPHLFTRTRDFAREFAAALASADSVYLTEIYPARERPLPGVTSELIASAFGSEKGRLTWRGERSVLADALAAGVREGDVVITMGAGDITRTGPELLQRLRGAAA